MNKKQKAAQVAKILNELYPNPAIPLLHKDPYTLLIAVLLSAQCTDKCVNKITPQLFKKADTPKKMVKLSVEEIQDIIRPCGLSDRKAKAIHALSEILIKNFKGQVPATLEDLMALPGVGRKTASVVLCQAFGIPAFPVDTHILRCAVRWGLSKGKTAEAVEKDLRPLFPEETWIKLHLQIIYCGREYCRARNHDASACPVCSAC
jgi:endonuclease III